MPSIQDLHSEYPEFREKGYNDVEAVTWIAEQMGVTAQDVAVHYGMIDPNQGDFSRGVSSGVDSAQGGLYGLAGYAGAVAGSDTVRDWGYKNYSDQMDEVALRAKPTDNIENAEGVGDVVDAAQYWVGYAIPQIVEAVVGSKGAGFAGKKVVERQIKKELETKFGKNTGAINAVMNSKATQEAIDKAGKFGNYAGIGTQAIGTELGYTYGGAVDEALHDGGTIEDVDLGRATKYGLAAGVTEFASDVLTLGAGKIGPAKNLMDKLGNSKSRVGNAFTKGTATGTMEAGTEVVQTGLEEMGAGKSYEEANFSDPTSAFAGFVGGGSVGGLSGLASRPSSSATELTEEAKVADSEAKQKVIDAQQRQDEEEALQMRQEAQEVEVQKAKTEARRKHNATFPNMKEWNLEAKQDQAEQQQVDLANPSSELGQEFEQWQNETQEWDTEEDGSPAKSVIKNFLKGRPKIAPEVEKEAYLGALDAHAEFKETQALRTPEQEAEVQKSLGEALAVHAEAVVAGKLDLVRAVNNEGSTMFGPAEWQDAKRKYTVENTTEEGSAGTTEEQIAAEGALAKFGISPSNAAPTEAEAETAVVQLMSLLDSGSVEYATIAKNQQKVMSLLKKALLDGTAENYLAGNELNNAAIVQELGLASSSSVTKAIKGAGKGKGKGGARKAVSKASSTVVDAAMNEIKSKDDKTVTKDADPTVPNYKGQVDAANLGAHDGSNMQVIGSFGGTGIGTGANAKTYDKKAVSVPDRDAKDKIVRDEKGKKVFRELTPEEFEGKADAFKMSWLTRVSDSLFSEASESWNSTKSTLAPEFSDLSTGAKYDWILTVAHGETALETETLQEEQRTVEERHDVNNIESKPNEKKNSGTAAKKQESTKGSSDGDVVVAKGKPKSGTSKSSKRVRKPAEIVKLLKLLDGAKVKYDIAYALDAVDHKENNVLLIDAMSKKELVAKKEAAMESLTKETNVEAPSSKPVKTDKKAAAAYAKKHIGANWETKRKVLVALLKKQDLTKFYSIVDKVAAYETPNAEPVNQPSKEASTGKPKTDSQGNGPKETSTINAPEDESELKFAVESVGNAKALPKGAETASDETFVGMFLKLLGKRTYDNVSHRIRYFENQEEASKALDAKLPKGMRGGVLTIDGEKHVVFIKDRIKKGDELSVFMHEVGGHVGMDSVLDEDQIDLLASRIMRWATEGGTSTENIIARAVKRRVAKAKSVGAADAETSEWVAYFLEEAIIHGVKPTSKTKLGKMVDDILTKFRAAYRKFMASLGADGAELTAQDIVDMAYGAAKMELAGDLYSYADGSPKFSVDTVTNEAEVRSTRDWVRERFGPTTTKMWDNIVEMWRTAVASTKNLHAFINDVRDKMPSAMRWYEALLKAEKTRNEIKNVAQEYSVRAREMAADKLEALNEFIGDSTFRQKWGYNPYDKNDPRYNTVEIDDVMEVRFNNLDKEQKQLVKDVFAHGEAMLQRKRDIAEAFGVDSKFFGVSGLPGPYAPLKRFGSYASEFKSQKLLDAEETLSKDPSNKDLKAVVETFKSSGEHYVISFHDTIGAAKQVVDANKKDYAYSEASPRTGKLDEGRSPDHQVLSKVLGALGADKFDASSAEHKAIKKMVEQMYFNTLEDTNARQSQALRKGRAGYDRNMMRSFLSHATAEANLIANMEHGTEINEALGTANSEQSKDRGHLGRVYNMMVSHYSEMLNNKETPIQDRLAAVNTVYMLTSSIGYHVTNATQPLMVTLPKLAGDFGDYSGAWNKLTKGYKISKDVVSIDFSKLQVVIDPSKAPKKYRKLLEDLQLRQLLDVGIEQDLSEYNRFDSGFALLDKASNESGKFAHRLYQVARLVEGYNRVSSAIAAYDMASENPKVPNRLGVTPMEYATNIVQDTQGNFSSMDAPLILKKLPKITVQYRKYQFMMAWVYSNATKQAFKGSSPEEKAAGKRTVGYALWHASLFAGATGVPILGQVAPYFLAIGNEGDEPEDLERWIQRNVGDENLATVLTRGLPALFGLDASTKLSQGKIFSALPFVEFDSTQEGIRDTFFGAVLGPTGSTASNFARSVEYASEGNLYRATEYALPKGFRSVMESYRLGTEGYSLRNGDIPVGPEEFSMLSLGLNALGIPSTDINKIKWTRGQQYELGKWASDEQSDIRKAYVKAKKNGDSSGQKDARNRWKELQNSKKKLKPFFNNEPGAMKVTPLSNLLKAPNKQREREKKYAKQAGY